MTTRVLLVAALLLAFAATGRASDRRAHMIDTIGIYASSHDNGSNQGAELWGETATAAENEKWAILLGGGFDRYAPDDSRDIDGFNIGIGLKYYISSLLSVSAVARYWDYDSDLVYGEIIEGVTSAKLRLTSARESVSPFLTASISWRSNENDTGVAREFQDTVTQFGGGCDFMMTGDMAIVFEGAAFSTTEVSGNSEELSGARIGVYMQYYWK